MPSPFCQRDGQDARLINMLGQSRAISLTEDTLTIEAPSRFAIAQLKKHQPTIEAYLEEIAFAPIALDIVAPQAPQRIRCRDAPRHGSRRFPGGTDLRSDVPTIEHQHSDVSRETMAPLPTAAATSNERTRHAHAYRSRRSGGRGFGHCNQEHALGR